MNESVEMFFVAVFVSVIQMFIWYPNYVIMIVSIPFTIIIFYIGAYVAGWRLKKN